MDPVYPIDENQSVIGTENIGIRVWHLPGGVRVRNQGSEFGVEHFLHNAHRRQRGRCSAVARCVDDGFGDFGSGEAVAKRPSYVAREFLVCAQRDEDS